jgi:hypothetical protein
VIAALYVETDGVYYGLDDVDPWDEQRDARLYAGPWPVVAHPPCNRWSSLAWLNQHLHGYEVGDDGGCFEAALAAVRRWGGVLEHPAYSIAWKRYGLPLPVFGAWTRSLLDDGWVTEVEQASYGHRARKRTWLYLIGDPVPLDWRRVDVAARISSFVHAPAGALNMSEEIRVRPAEASRTPLAFRDVLLDAARSCLERVEARDRATA